MNSQNLRARPMLAIALVMATLLTAFAASAQTAPASSAKRTTWTNPKTPWGDPDLQGMWPSGAMTGVPFQRPESFGERSELTDAEFAARQKSVDAQRTGSFAVNAWGEPGKAQRQASLLVEPSNGRLPAMTPEGMRRSQYLHSSWQNIWFDNVSDFDSWDRCITRGLLPSMLPAQYSNGIQIHQAPGYVVIRNEMIHENPSRSTAGRTPVQRSKRIWATRVAIGTGSPSSSRRPTSTGRLPPPTLERAARRCRTTFLRATR
jgi:hypothetical protein